MTSCVVHGNGHGNDGLDMLCNLLLFMAFDIYAELRISLDPEMGVPGSGPIARHFVLDPVLQSRKMANSGSRSDPGSSVPGPADFKLYLGSGCVVNCRFNFRGFREYTF